jgi:thiosulfate/3-mercaptopyruvate sulfurtransferase
MPANYARPELLASVDWLAGNLSRSGVRIVDCRWRTDRNGGRLFATGHVPSAVHVDWAADLVDGRDPLPYQLAGPEQFATAMSRLGIGDGMTVVVYDDASSLYAARVWWSLQVYGFESVRIVDGGWPAWVESGRPQSTGAGPAEHATFTPRLDPRRRLSTSDVLDLLGSSDVDLVDARSPADYLGQQGTSARVGHIPGAVNIPAVRITQPGTQRLQPADVLVKIFGEAGLARGRRIVAYDGSGVGAALIAFGLALLGYPDVAVYDAGWAEWGERVDLPLNR